VGTERKADRIDDLEADGALFDVESEDGTFKIILPPRDRRDAEEPSETER
jgi:hypothetical protein